MGDYLNTHYAFSCFQNNLLLLFLIKQYLTLSKIRLPFWDPMSSGFFCWVWKVLTPFWRCDGIIAQVPKVVEGLSGKTCTFLLADLWFGYYYGKTVWFVGNLNQLWIFFDQPVTAANVLIYVSSVRTQYFLLREKNQPIRTKATRVVAILSFDDVQATRMLKLNWEV